LLSVQGAYVLQGQRFYEAKLGMIDEISQGSSDCMVEIKKVGLPFIDSPETPSDKKRKIEISQLYRFQ
jgi:hypothetical protein